MCVRARQQRQSRVHPLAAASALSVYASASQHQLMTISRTPSDASSEPTQVDIDVIRRAAASWRELVCEADAMQEAGFFPVSSSDKLLTMPERVRAREIANAHWQRHGPRLRMLETYLWTALMAQPNNSLIFQEADVAFFMLALRRQNPQLLHLYRR